MSLDRTPALGAGTVARAFPFHVWFDSALRLQGAGASLQRALPSLHAGAALDGLFDVRRPRAPAGIDDWRRHAGDLCTLRAVGDVPLTLRGSAEVLEDGSLLLLVSPVVTSLEQLRQLGLGFNDFARHDAVGELLLLARTMQMSHQDAERLAERLRLRSEQLDAILELGQNGVVSFDAEGELLHVNGALLRMLGLRREDTPGLTLAALQSHLDTLLDNERGGRGALRRMDGEGTLTLHLAVPRPAVVELTIRRGADGGQVSYWRDVTAESEVDRMKSEFLSTAAHELRTPMVSVHGFTELLLNRPMNEERRIDALQTIHRQSSRLIHMVNELLDLARIESRQGKDLHREPLRLEQLVRDNVEAMRGALERHAIRVELPHGGATLLIDAAKSAQALTNVLSNAVKYSPDGGEIVVSSVEGEAVGQRMLGVRVVDCGIGMTPEQLARVFERFYRADPSGTIAGTGLGMCLVKEIVELQGGLVDVASEPGRGTTVTLWFPVSMPSPLTQPGDALTA